MTLRRALSSSGAGELFPGGRALTLLRATWPHAVGPRLAQRTEVLALEGRTLIVRVPDGRWRRILHRLRHEILARLHGLAGAHAPAALGFMEAPAGEATSPQAPDPPRPAPAAAPPPPGLARSGEIIADAEIRALFLAAAARYLARKSGA